MKSRGNSANTPGRRLFADQIALIQQGQTDELIERHYHPDAVLISTTNAVRGHAALKIHFGAYAKMLARIEVLSLDAFAETDDSILLEATMHTAVGESRVYDAFVLRDGKITHHFPEFGKPASRSPGKRCQRRGSSGTLARSKIVVWPAAAGRSMDEHSSRNFCGSKANHDSEGTASHQWQMA